MAQMTSFNFFQYGGHAYVWADRSAEEVLEVAQVRGYHVPAPQIWAI